MKVAKHLLIVDDEPNIRLMLRTALESPETKITSAEDGNTAIAELQAGRFDLVLLDLKMPGLDGLEVLETIRASGNNVPVVFLTAHGTIPDAVRAMKLGAIDFLTKPTPPDVLRAVIADVLSRKAIAEDRPNTLVPVTPESEFARNLDRAKNALNARDFAQADVFLRQAIALGPGSAEAHNLMGVLHECRNEHDASYREYRAALKADRHYLPAVHNMQRYYERFTFGASDLPLDTGSR